jgi:uncharacterized protein involved in exopolysaccharide biosynthesis
VAGCEKKPTVKPVPRPDVAILDAAINGESDLVTLYEAVTAQHADLTQQLAPMLAHHREHLSVLRRHYQPGTGEGTPTPAPPATPPEVPEEPGQAIAALRKAERQAAAARLVDVGNVSPGVAQLMASIGASEAGHAAVLARST